ncbi:saccharopine dehydrogenase family protein [Paenibacillus aquistagni]|uniref:Saccharopine dehydrogenase, NADP-dependent n=1 Tax=Paenibacillus aquistagni TaxID=1852522 RepID=A0A1X7JBI4_9BACL|nr:saccharopine dehydrogenase C-terminal domain-containing protein [Paenibacillus aquistagni]SMG24906.1 Saccharopine dehydrogenase, NADP-dependent [Paenibacillus aquistagni]
MKVCCLGGAGKIAREAVLDLVQYSSFDQITVADFSVEEGQQVVEWLNDPRVDFVQVDVRRTEETAANLSCYDIVMDATTISLNGLSTRAIALAGCHGINLNGFGEEFHYADLFKANGKIHVPGFGMTPGVTQMMAMHAANQLDVVDTIRVSHGSYRPIAFSKSIAETTTYEYDPDLPGRVVYEDGAFIQVPPFARPLDIKLPEPYGVSTQYIIPHSETRTLAQALKHKGVHLIEVRGTWPEANMRLVRSLYEYGILQNPTVDIEGTKVGVLDCISTYLAGSSYGQETEVYGYALHVEVSGTKEGNSRRHVLTHTHPKSDGSAAGWEGLRAYTRNVGIPLAIATELIASGHVKQAGMLNPEDAFNPETIFHELARREIYIHEEVVDRHEEHASVFI